MPFFDSMDWSDPSTMAAMQALSGVAGAFGQAAMPSRLPVPMGAVLGSAAEAMNKGRVAGAKSAIDLRGASSDLATKNIGLDQALIIENMLRKALGKPELTAADLQGGGMATRSPLFGAMTMAPPPSPAAPVIPGQLPGQTGGAGPQASGGAAPGTGESSNLGNALVSKMLGFTPTDYQRAKMAADLMPAGPGKLEAERAAAKLAGIDVTLNQRAGEASSLYNPVTGKYEEVSRNPNLSPDISYDPQTGTASVVPGALEAMGQLADTSERAKANFKPLNTYDPAGNEYIQPASVLHPEGGAPAPAGQPAAGQMPYAQRVAQLEGGGQADPAPNAHSSAAGPDQFLNGTWLDQAKKYLPPQVTQGKSDEQILALRTNPQVSEFLTNRYASENAKALQTGGIKEIGAPELYLAHHFGPDGATTILKAPVNTPLSKILSAKVMQANPELQGATVADVYAQAHHAMRGVQFGVQAAPTPRAAPVSGEQPKTPVQDSQSGIPTKLDDFLGQLGPTYQPPGRPAVPAGALMGEPGKGTEEIQKLDGERLEQYSKEAAGGQKVYTNLQQLYQIMGRGLSTGNLTGEATPLTNLARQVGLSALIPKSFDPSDAAAFNKLATDLVFAQLKQIGGRPMVSEIEGLKQANPNTSLPPAANIEILNNILADQRWRDSRSDLGRQYMSRFGSLGDFDARFNEKYPQVDVFNNITNATAKAGWFLPGGPGTPSGRGVKQFDPKVQAQITPAAITATAKKYGETEDQVKAKLKAQGYQLP